MQTIDSGTEITAKKEHKCNFCSEKIKKGEKYISAVYKTNETYTFKTHKSCTKIAEVLKMYNDCEFVSPDDFVDNIYAEAFGLIPQKSPFREILNAVLTKHEILPI